MIKYHVIQKKKLGYIQGVSSTWTENLAECIRLILRKI